jgi:2'-5' RNA ligase
VRAFVALFLPAEIQQALAQAVTPLRARVHGLRWVRAEQLHVTLAFLGEIDADAARSRYVPALEPLAACAAPRVRLDSFGTFPTQRRPRVLWAGFAGDVDDIARLATGVADALRPLGYHAEERGFTPHVTLARARDRGPGPELAEALAGCALRATEFSLARFGLFRSERGPGGSEYVAVWERGLVLG